jgi:hypothetical protein
MDLEAWCLWYKRRGAGRLRHLLMRHWDPIGVRGAPSARDEYDRYIGRIAERLRRDGGARDVADLLTEIASKSMGMPATRSDLMPTARLLVDWYHREVDNASKPGDIRGH